MPKIPLHRRRESEPRGKGAEGDGQENTEFLQSIRSFNGVVDNLGRLVFADEAAIKTMGGDTAEVLQKPFWEARWFESSPKAQQAVKAGIMAAIEGETVLCPVQAFTPEGKPLPITFRIGPLASADGNIISIVAEVESLEHEEIASTEATPLTLPASSKKLTSVLDLMQEGYLETDNSERVTLANPFAVSMLGYSSPEEIIGKRTGALWADPEKRDLFLIELSRKGKVERYRASWLRRDGTEVPLEVQARLLLGTGEEPEGSQVTFTEIRETPGITKSSAAEEGTYLKFIQTLSDVVYVLDLKGRFTYVNPQCEQTTGYTRPELLGHPFTDLLTPESADRAVASFKKGLAGDKTSAYEVELVRKDGHRIPLELQVTSLLDEQGKAAGRIGVARDISDRKKAEEALLESEKRYRDLYDNSPYTYFSVSAADASIIRFNTAALRLLGYSSQELTQLKAFDLYADTPDGRDKAKQVFQRFKAGESIRDVELQMKRKDGSSLWVSLSVDPILDPSGKVVESRSVVIDITERKRAEQALRESEEHYRLFTETMDDVIWTTNMELRTTYISPSVFRQTGYTVEEALEQTIDQKVTPASLQSLIKLFGEQLELEKTGTADPNRWTRTEVEICRKDGSTVWGEMLVAWLRDSERHIAGLLGVTRDITERKAAEEALRKADKRYRSVISNPLNCVFVANEQGIMVEANEATMKFLDLSQDDVGKVNILSFVHPEDLSIAATTMAESINKGHGDAVQMRVISRSGRVSWVEVYSNNLEVQGDHRLGVGIFHDITERRQAAEALKKSEEKLKELVERLSLSQEALSTPVVQIWDKVLALPLIGVIDDQRAQRIMEVVLRKIVETQSETLILDVTGVASIDTTVTNHLLQTVQSASMLGAKCILTGIRPEVAHAVTSLGMDMSKVMVKRDLQDGLRWALQNLGQGGSHPEATYHHRR